MSDSGLRPRGTVEVPCSGPNCRGEWYFWVEALDPRLPDGPFICPTCESGQLFQDLVSIEVEGDRCFYILACGHKGEESSSNPVAFAMVCPECSNPVGKDR